MRIHGLVAATLVSTGVQAQSLAFNAGLTSDYVSRGFTQSWSRPALQGGVDWSHPSGWFAGSWASTLSEREFGNGRLEIDLYAGITQALGAHSLTLAYYLYRYPGSRSPAIDGRRYDYDELKFGWSWTSWTLNHFIATRQDWFGTVSDGRGSTYTELNWSPALAEGWTALLHVGAGRIKRHPEAQWTDLRLGVQRSLEGGWSTTLAYTRVRDRNDYWAGFDLKGSGAFKDFGKPTWAVTLTRSF